MAHRVAYFPRARGFDMISSMLALHLLKNRLTHTPAANIACKPCSVVAKYLLVCLRCGTSASVLMQLQLGGPCI